MSPEGLREKVGEAIYNQCSPSYEATITTDGDVTGPTRSTWATAGSVHRAICLRMADDCIRVVVEACAKVCEKRRHEADRALIWHPDDTPHRHDLLMWREEAGGCAKEVRELLPKEEP